MIQFIAGDWVGVGG